MREKTQSNIVSYIFNLNIYKKNIFFCKVRLPFHSISVMIYIYLLIILKTLHGLNTLIVIGINMHTAVSDI